MATASASDDCALEETEKALVKEFLDKWTPSKTYRNNWEDDPLLKLTRADWAYYKKFDPEKMEEFVFSDDDKESIRRAWRKLRIGKGLELEKTGEGRTGEILSLEAFGRVYFKKLFTRICVKNSFEFTPRTGSPKPEKMCRTEEDVYVSPEFAKHAKQFTEAVVAAVHGLPSQQQELEKAFIQLGRKHVDFPYLMAEFEKGDFEHGEDPFRVFEKNMVMYVFTHEFNYEASERDQFERFVKFMLSRIKYGMDLEKARRKRDDEEEKLIAKIKSKLSENPDSTNDDLDRYVACAMHHLIQMYQIRREYSWEDAYKDAIG